MQQLTNAFCEDFLNQSLVITVMLVS